MSLDSLFFFFFWIYIFHFILLLINAFFDLSKSIKSNPSLSFTLDCWIWPFLSNVRISQLRIVWVAQLVWWDTPIIQPCLQSTLRPTSFSYSMPLRNKAGLLHPWPRSQSLRRQRKRVNRTGRPEEMDNQVKPITRKYIYITPSLSSTSNPIPTFKNPSHQFRIKRKKKKEIRFEGCFFEVCIPQKVFQMTKHLSASWKKKKRWVCFSYLEIKWRCWWCIELEPLKFHTGGMDTVNSCGLKPHGSSCLGEKDVWIQYWVCQKWD